MNYTGNEYFYITNLQGDIIELVDINGNTVVSYKYDAWVNIIYQTDSILARANPYRYRGYRYDEETSLYYCNSRYYNPEWGRWLNADDPNITLSLGLYTSNGLNLYGYCFNNQVMFYDYSGYWPKKIGDWYVYDNRLRFRFDDLNSSDEHIHVEYGSAKFSWYRNDHNTKDGSTFGLSDLAYTPQKTLKKSGVPKDYFDRFSIYKQVVSLETIPIIHNSSNIISTPIEQATSTLETIPTINIDYGIETFPMEEALIIVAIVFFAVCIVAAPATGGLSLIGLGA